MLLPTMILCLVSSTFACSAYTNASIRFDTTHEFLKSEQLSWETPSQYDVNYVSLVVAMKGICYTMIDGLSYDAAYTQWHGLVVLSKEFPTQARDIILANIQEVAQKTLSIRNLVNETCGSEVSEDCDCKVEEAIKDDAKLQAQAALLLEFVASSWAGYQDDWTTVATFNTVDEYLAANKEVLRAPIEAKVVQYIMMKSMDLNEDLNGYSD